MGRQADQYKRWIMKWREDNRVKLEILEVEAQNSDTEWRWDVQVQEWIENDRSQEPAASEGLRQEGHKSGPWLGNLGTQCDSASNEVLGRRTGDVVWGERMGFSPQYWKKER